MQQDRARRRAELIMKVRCGILTAKQAAAQLGVSRKTNYKWEQRGLAALLAGLDDQQAGRRNLRYSRIWRSSWPAARPRSNVCSKH